MAVTSGKSVRSISHSGCIDTGLFPVGFDSLDPFGCLEF